MTVTQLAGSRRWRWVLGLLCTLSAASCRHDPDRVAGFVVAMDQLQDARCRCASRASQCFGDASLASECAQRAVKKHQDALEDWLVCTTREVRATTECVRNTDCDELDDGACDLELDDACGEPPPAAARAVEDEIEQLCPEQIDCEDGSVAEGHFCNGELDCRDGSDEVFCGDGDSSGGLPPPPPPAGALGSAPFFCPDGSVIPVAEVCDGFASCLDGADEVPCFQCSDGSGQVIRAALSCDGVSDCSDGSDELHCDGGPIGHPPSDTTVEMCVQATPLSPRINPSCVHCGCSVSLDAAVACDAVCWALIECVLEHCPDAAAGSMEQAQCAVANCAEHLSAAATATTLGMTLRTTCSAVCPPF